jgi:hypothetical protein
MKPTAPLQNKSSVLATTPARGLSLSHEALLHCLPKTNREKLTTERNHIWLKENRELTVSRQSLIK